MEINSLESQLTNIVNSTPPISQANNQTPDQSKEIPVSGIEEAVDIVSQELEVFNTLKNEGRELEYLENNTEAMNIFFKEINLNVNFKIESSEVGYIVKVVNENGEVIKTIPGEQVVQTRQNIREMIKGIFEDESR